MIMDPPAPSSSASVSEASALKAEEEDPEKKYFPENYVRTGWAFKPLEWYCNLTSYPVGNSFVELFDAAAQDGDVPVEFGTAEELQVVRHNLSELQKEVGL